MIRSQKYRILFKLKELSKKNWELIVNISIFLAITIPLLLYSYFLNNRHIIYALDDAYIHLAIAKNLAKYGIWGITRKKFSSSSSSLLYSLLLAFLFLFGVNEYISLFINIIFSVLLLFLIQYILKIENKLPSYAIIICSIFMILFLPLPFLIFTGMEHVIQICIDISFVYIASKILYEEKRKIILLLRFRKEGKLKISKDQLLLLIAPLVTMVRFEGMFIIIAICALFLLRKRFLYSFLIGVFSFLPIFIFGIISIFQGWFFLPNSVILKGNEPDFSTFEGILDFFNPKLLIKAPHISILLLSALLIFIYNYYRKKEIWSQKSAMSFIFILVTLLHLLFVGITDENQNVSRYDSYLVALGLLLIFLSIKDGIPQQLSIFYLKKYLLTIKQNYKKCIPQIIPTIFIIIFLFYSNVPRSYNLIRKSPQASNNIYEQPYHVALFLEKYYDGECIAANDIGAMNYYADIECLDLRGLGSKDVAEAQLNGEFGTAFVKKEAEKRDCKIAVIFEHKDYGYGIPDEWIKAGEWTVRHNVVLGDDEISFWAVDPSEFNDLVRNLKDFSNHLPTTVIESGNYTK